MNPPFSLLFTQLQDRIASELPDIAHIAHDLGQLQAKGRLPLSFPCVLIDFDDFSFTNLGEHIQSAVGVIAIKLVFAPHSGTAQYVPEVYKQKAISYYDIEFALNRALHGWSPPIVGFGSLIRTSVATIRRTDSFRVREIKYNISFEDYSTKIQQQYAAARLVVSV